MEIGVFGSPGSLIFAFGVLFGILGLVLLVVSVLIAFTADRNEKVAAGIVGIIAFAFLAASMTLLPIGHGKQRVGDCFDRLPAATFPVDSAFIYDDEVLYIVVRGKNDDDKVVRECATLPMSIVKDYPDRPVAPGEYWIVVEDHESGGVKWTTNTFVPAVAPDKSK